MDKEVDLQVPYLLVDISLKFSETGFCFYYAMLVTGNLDN